MSKAKAKARKVSAGLCISCRRELQIHHADEPTEALKRRRWSNLNLSTKPITGLCPSCRKRGNHK